MEKTYSRKSFLHQSVSLMAALIAVFAIVAVLGDNDAYAKTVTAGDFSVDYRQMSDGSIKDIAVSAYNGHTADAVLPAEFTVTNTDGSTKQVPIPTFKPSVFKENTAINSVTIPENYTDIPSDAFKGCTGLTSVSIPGSLTMIGSNAFEGCTALETVTFAPDTAADLSIKNAAFLNCSSLKSLELPARLNDIMNNNSFLRGCTSLTSLTVSDGCTAYFAENNMLFARGDTGASIIVYPFGLAQGKIELPATAGGLDVVETGAHFLRGNAALTEVTIPASYKTIGMYSFEGCSKLMTVNVLSEEPITLDSSCFTNLPAGSVINVPNETVAAGFEPDPNELYASPCYTPEKTTVTVKAAAPKTVEAALTVKAAGITEAGEAAFDLYLDSASYVSTIVAKFTYDPAQFSFKSAVLAGGVFENVSNKQADGSFDLMFNQLNNVEGYTGAEPVKIATITMTKQADATGALALTLSKATVSGVTDVNADAVSGTVTISTASAEVFVANYDVNLDGTVDQVDITEAQRYYQETSAGEKWTAAKKADVNGDGTVDLEDLIAIFHNLTNF